MDPTTELDRVCVVLVSTRNPLNIGAVARAMSNFGVSRLRVVNPYEAAFREAKSAVGASGLLKNAEQYTSLAAALGDCTVVVGTTAGAGRQLKHPIHSLPDAAALIRPMIASTKARIALVFGSEKRGLSNADLSHCHWLLRIPTRAEHGSMNLGQAAAVCLYELSHSSERPPGQSEIEPVPAKSAELERVTATLTELLRMSGYFHSLPTASDLGDVRILIRRMRMTAEDAQTCLGMLRQILWKLNHSGPTQK